MSSFRFMHAADLHLGSPFKGLTTRDETVARRFAEATRAAFVNLVDRAIEEQAAFMVIAGDVYDGEWRDNAIGLFFNREVARLDRAGIPVFVLKGNHDADSVVTRSISLPDSVRSFGTRAPETFEIEHLRVALHGQGFAERVASDNMALRYPEPVPGWFNIGVLHTSLTGRPPHATYAPCSVDDLRSRGYDYWALGHVHKFEVVAREPAIVFPGNLQGRSIREQGAKGAVLVSVSDGRVTDLERVIVDEARWHEIEVDLGDAEEIAVLLARIEDALAGLARSAEHRSVALRVRLVGATPLYARLHAERGAIVDEIQAASQRVSPDIWLEKVEYRVTSPRVEHAASGLAEWEAMLAEAASGQGIEAEAARLIEEIAAKLPPGARSDVAGFDIAELISTAQALVRDRLTRGN